MLISHSIPVTREARYEGLAIQLSPDLFYPRPNNSLRVLLRLQFFLSIWIFRQSSQYFIPFLVE